VSLLAATTFAPWSPLFVWRHAPLAPALDDESRELMRRMRADGPVQGRSSAWRGRYTDDPEPRREFLLEIGNPQSLDLT
jgi:hypothetical protein